MSQSLRVLLRSIYGTRCLTVAVCVCAVAILLRYSNSRSKKPVATGQSISLQEGGRA
jgi:hypothetical protein